MTDHRHIPWNLSSLPARRLALFGLLFLASTVIPLSTLGNGMSNVKWRMSDVVSGRFSSLRAFAPSRETLFSYSYLPNTDLISGYTADDFTRTVSYEPARSLITSVENKHHSTTISQYDYENDVLGRRTARVDSGIAFANPAFDAYSYNQRSEVTGAQRHHGTDTADTSKIYGGRQFGYAYDPIGNRISATETIGGQILSKSYAANELNQYTTINNPAAVGLRGSVTNGATVTVNMQPVQSDNIAADTIPWHYALEAENATGSDCPYAEIVATLNPPTTNGTAFVSTQSGHLYAPPQEEELLYDDDGNLTQDGRWQYTWNGENRLIKAVELIAPTNRQPYEVNYAYDHRGRMAWKSVAPTTAPPIKTIAYTWDDYNIIAEHVTTDTTSNTTYNLWGLDLSGTLQGAGGVGGVLAVYSPLPLGEGQGEGGIALPCYDANGNVTEYVSSNGTIAAHYEYSPFGEIIVQSGDLADSFTHRFSTKPWCAVTGLSEYEYRKYSPNIGRWISRDSIGEWGGINLFAALENAPIIRFDLYGKSCSSVAKEKPNDWTEAEHEKLKLMQDKSCPLPKVKCKRCCNEDVSGYLEGTYTIYICNKKGKTDGDYRRTRKHELSHAFDKCMGAKFNCTGEIDQFICSELRAYKWANDIKDKNSLIKRACGSFMSVCSRKVNSPILGDICEVKANDFFDKCTTLNPEDPLPNFPLPPKQQIKLHTLRAK